MQIVIEFPFSLTLGLSFMLEAVLVGVLVELNGIIDLKMLFMFGEGIGTFS